jgi:hypothetical protein
VTLFTNNFQGKSLEILKTEPCLSDYNFEDITSSLIIEYVPKSKYQYLVRGCANETNTIKCPTGFFLKDGIITYGKWDNDKCGFQPNNKIKHKKTLFEVYGNEFINKKEFEVKINDELFNEETIKGINKSYEIEYNCKNNTNDVIQDDIKINIDKIFKNKIPKIIRGCENETAVLNCNNGEYINNAILFYGKWDADRCGDFPETDVRNKKDLLELLKKKGEKNQNLIINIEDKLLSDNTNQKIKQSFEIQYSCLNKSNVRKKKTIANDRIHNIQMESIADKRILKEVELRNNSLQNKIDAEIALLDKEEKLLEKEINAIKKIDILSRVKNYQKNLSDKIIEKGKNEMLILKHKLSSCKVSENNLLYKIKKLKKNK